MSEMLSRWPVLISVALVETDRDDNRVLTDTAVERAFALARSAYFDRCRTVAQSDTSVVAINAVVDAPVDTNSIDVSVGVVEIYPDRFTMELRARPSAGEGVAARGRCTLALAEITDQTRDEFIRLAHGARYIN